MDDLLKIVEITTEVKDICLWENLYVQIAKEY